jgi:hypothetical protein
MDFLKFLRKHYEKVLLSAVLAALAGAAVFLLMGVSTEREKLEEIKNLDVRSGTRALPTVDLTTNEMVLRRLRRPEPVVLEGDHNLFNPVTWQRRPDGNLLKIVTGTELGPGALRIQRISPLRLIVSYEGSVARGSGTSHRFKVTREAHRIPGSRSPVTRETLGGVGEKNDLFVVRELRPNAENPTEFVLEMVEDRTQVTVGKDSPYEGVAGYMVDLQYEPRIESERQLFLNRRVHDRLVFAGDTNTIVTIEPESVTVEAISNNKRTTITHQGVVPETPGR